MEVFKVAMYTNQNVIQLGEFMKCHSGYQRGASKLIVQDRTSQGATIPRGIRITRQPFYGIE